MTDLIKSAEIFARSRHAGQFRKGDAQEPYIVHVEEVAELVTAWGGSESAWQLPGCMTLLRTVRPLALLRSTRNLAQR